MAFLFLKYKYLPMANVIWSVGKDSHGKKSVWNAVVSLYTV